MNKPTVGFAMCGSFCTFRKAIDALRTLTATYRVLPILSGAIIAPCTGNTLGKLAYGIADSPVTFACKAHLRNARPVVLAVSTNDGLSASAESIGRLLNRKHYYFVPFGQDAAEKKPYSLVADLTRLPETAAAALQGRQIQPILL